MKNTIKLTGLALIAAITIVFASCGGDDAGSKGTAPTITTATLPGGTVGTAYSQTLEATGDTPITWSIDSGALPGGLTLSAVGVISGTPATAGAFSFTVKAANATGSATKQLSIAIEKTITLERNTGDGYDNWQCLDVIPSSVTGGQIAQGDEYTLTYLFKSNVTITGNLSLWFVDTSHGWNIISNQVNISGITANADKSGRFKFTFNQTASVADYDLQLVFNVNPLSNAPSAPTLTFTTFTLEKTESEWPPTSLTLERNTGEGYDNWQNLCNIPSQVTGGKITKGDKYTFTYSFKSNVNITKLEMALADNTEAGGWWTILSSEPKASIEGITANATVSGTKEFVATKSASSTNAGANIMQFVVERISDATGEPTLTFTNFSITKTGTVLTFERETGPGYDTWQYKYEIPSSVTGGKITQGDVYTFKYSFTSNVAITGELILSLVDCFNGCEAISGGYNYIDGITAYGVKSGTINIVANKSSSSAESWANLLVFNVNASYAASAPTLTFIDFSLEKTGSENEVKSMTLSRNPYSDNWQFLYNIPSSVRKGTKITTGDKFTLTYSFKSNVNIEKLEMALADNTEAANWWTLLSEEKASFIENIRANVTVSGSITIVATKSASSTDTAANIMQFVVDPTSAASGEPTLTFTAFTLVKE